MLKKQMTKNYAIGILLFIGLNSAYSLVILSDVIQKQSRVPPWLVYILLNILIPLVGWVLYLWPSKDNWLYDRSVYGFPLYYRKMLRWMIMDNIIWLVNFAFTIGVFTRVGFSIWPSRDDSISDFDINLFFFMVIMSFDSIIIRICFLLWDAFWLDVLRSYDPLACLFHRSSGFC